MRKVVSGVMLTLLFLASLTPMFSVQLVNAEEELPIVWEAVYDEGKSEFFSNVVVDSNGNLIAVGNVLNYSTGEVAGIVAKYNGAGELLWLEKLQPYPFTNLNGIAVDSNDNIVAFGVTSTNPDMQDYGGSQIAEWLIAKFYPNGTLMWQTYYRKEGMGYHREGMYGIVTYNDQIICTGVAGYQFRVIKLDINGSLLWETQPSIGAQGTGMAIDKNGDILVVGQTSLYPYSDVVLVKLSQSGSELWVKVFDWGGNEVGKDIGIDKDGNLIIIGGSPPFILKLSPTGDIIWREEYQRPGAVDVWNLCIWPDRYGFGITGTSPPYYVEYDVDGNMVYEVSFRGGSISIEKQGRLTGAYLIGTWPDVNATLTIYNYFPITWTGTVYIRADGSIYPSEAPIISYDNVTYTLTGKIISSADGIVVERNHIIIDGLGNTVVGKGKEFAAYGVKLSSINNVTITNINIKEFYIGIYLERSSKISVNRCNITLNSHGIFLSSCLDSVISETNLKSNYYGIVLVRSSNNTIFENNILNNALQGLALSYSSNNQFFHNNFVGNTEHVYIWELGYTNIWDNGYPNGGNYWDNYGDKYPNASEIDGSGIWDTPYVINANNQDNYPLMNPWGVLPVVTVYIKADGSIHPSDAPILTIDNITYTLTNNIYGPLIVQRDNITINGAGFILQEWDGLTGIDVSNRRNVTVKNINIKGFEYGIWLISSSESSILESNITNNKIGIYLDSSSNNTIAGNGIRANEDEGVYMWSSSYNSIVKNHIIKNGKGIYVGRSNYNNISQNNITENSCGIDFWGSSSNDVYENNITANKEDGVFLMEGWEYYPGGMNIIPSDENVIAENNLTANGYAGIRCISGNNTILFQNDIENNYVGIFLSNSFRCSILSNHITANKGYGVYIWSSYNNSIYHNNFINNVIQVRITAGYTNIWDDGYPSGGNYWSDYAGVDLYSGPYQNEAGSDGIGDTPYIIDVNNVDKYPLMSPWSPISLKIFDVVCEGTHYSVSVQSNSTVTHFIFNQTLAQISFNVSGTSGTWGFCKITIPKALMTGPWTYTFQGDVTNIDVYEKDNETHTFINLQYKHASTFQVIIKASWVIPEYPSTPILISLIPITLTAAATLWKTKRKRHLLNFSSSEIVFS